MFDLFGIRRKRLEKQKQAEEKRLKEVQEEKERRKIREKVIREYLDNYYKEKAKKELEKKKELEEKIKIVNSTCPRCGSKDIINNIKQVKGELHGKGEIHGTSSSSLFTSSSYLSDSSKIDGELNTYPVNKCKNCGNEWEIKKIDKDDYDLPNVFSSWDCIAPGYLFRKTSEYLGLEFDPHDVNEKFNSLEEKQKDFCKSTSRVLKLYGYYELPKYMIDYLIYTGYLESHYYHCEEIFGDLTKESTTKYSYTIPPELWEIVKKLIDWKGTIENDPTH